jgi:hypothetical protein
MCGHSFTPLCLSLKSPQLLVWDRLNPIFPDNVLVKTEPEVIGFLVLPCFIFMKETARRYEKGKYDVNSVMKTDDSKVPFAFPDGKTLDFVF